MFDDDAALRRAPRAIAPVAVRRRDRGSRCTWRSIVAAETRAPGQGDRPPRGRDRARRTPSSATRASSRARRPRWWIRSSSAWPTSRRRCRRLRDQASSPGIVDLNSRARRRRAVEQLVDAPRHRPGAAQARLARGAGDARRDLQRRRCRAAAGPGRARRARGCRTRPRRCGRSSAPSASAASSNRPECAMLTSTWFGLQCGRKRSPSRPW